MEFAALSWSVITSGVVSPIAPLMGALPLKTLVREEVRIQRIYSGKSEEKHAGSKIYSKYKS